MGVVLILGVDTLRGLGDQVLGQLACLTGAALYAGAAIYGKRFSHLSVAATAAGTMSWATIVLVPAALVVEKPWTLVPDARVIVAVLALSMLCTGLALLIYFRLAQTLGSLDVASQSYLRAGVGVLLGVLFLGERLSPPLAIGLAAAVLGVALINWPTRETKAGR
jgi:drug/metabolite transporter (DMT)-like permease